MALSYVKVRAAQPEIKVYKLADDEGMPLLKDWEKDKRCHYHVTFGPEK
ncbi:hypothetical protein ACUOFC_21150 [Escherichia sp. TWPC-MK]